MPAVLLAGNWDAGCRRQFYGLAGEFRLPPHGLEYRTLSNFWLYHRSLAHLVFGVARAAFCYALHGLRGKFNVSEEDVQHIVNTNDAKAAAACMLANKQAYCEVLRGSFGWQDSTTEKTFQFIVDCAERGGFATRHGNKNILENWPGGDYWWRIWIDRYKGDAKHGAATTGV